MKLLSSARCAAALFAVLAGCDNECPRFNVILAIMDAPSASPPDDTPWIGGARGDLRYDIEDSPPADFELMLDALLSSTSTPSVVRWTAFTRDERMFLIDLPIAQPPGTVVPIQGVADDVEFTGGYDTFGWWQPRWSIEPSMANVARANLIRAFSRTQDMIAAEGTAEIIQVDPLEMRIDVIFTEEDGDQIRIFSDARFERRSNVEICSP